MIPETEIERCRRREAEERTIASHATSDASRDAHMGLAERYADRVWSLTEARDNPDADEPSIDVITAGDVLRIEVIGDELASTAFGNTIPNGEPT